MAVGVRGTSWGPDGPAEGLDEGGPPLSRSRSLSRSAAEGGGCELEAGGGGPG